MEVMISRRIGKRKGDHIKVNVGVVELAVISVEPGISCLLKSKDSRESSLSSLTVSKEDGKKRSLALTVDFLLDW